MSNESPAEALRQKADILIQKYGAESKGKLFSQRKALREPLLDTIMELVTAYAATVEREAAIRQQIAQALPAAYGDDGVPNYDPAAMALLEECRSVVLGKETE